MDHMDHEKHPPMDDPNSRHDTGPEKSEPKANHGSHHSSSIPSEMSPDQGAMDRHQHHMHEPPHSQSQPAGSGMSHVHGEGDQHAQHGEMHDHSQMEPGDHSKHEGQAHPAGHTDHTGHEAMFRRKFWVSLILSLPVLFFSQGLRTLLGFHLPAFPGSLWIAPVFSGIVFIYGGLPFLKMAVPELKNRQPGMMTLISLAISVAFIYSAATLFIPNAMDFFWELVTLIDIMLLGHWLEMRSIRQASGSLDALAKLMPDTAELLDENGGTRTVPVSSLKMNDRLLVRPGSSIPADGQIVEGESSVNESMITGESKPVSKQPGDKVIGGSINGDGSLRISVSATGDKTALAGIMRLVKQAQESKSNTQILADKAAGWLFYIALSVAAITAVAWTIGIGFNVQVIERVATVLVIACPHALGLAIPLVVAITTEIGARNGVLIRDRHQLETARDVDLVIFDKTGTLTEGRFGVVGIKTASEISENQALALTAAVEGDSEHSIAQGIRRSADEKGLQLPSVTDFEALKGRGIKAKLDGEDVYVGGPRLLEFLNLPLPQALSNFEQDANDKGQSVVHLVKGHSVLASLALADVIRPESRMAIKRLHELGIQVAMLTGDSEAVASSVARDLQIDTYYSQVLPEDKDKKVIELQKQGKSVAMVGDGVNDAPALTRADVGIAIGSGTDVAVESAGIILVKSNPLDVVKVIELSRASYRKMKQNLAWAVGYNVIALPLAAGVLYPWGILLSPAVGAILMSLSTIIVAINAQLLRNQV